MSRGNGARKTRKGKDRRGGCQGSPGKNHGGNPLTISRASPRAHNNTYEFGCEVTKQKYEARIAELTEGYEDLCPFHPCASCTETECILKGVRTPTDKDHHIKELGEAGELLTSLAFCLIEHVDAGEPACDSCRKMMDVLYKIEEKKDTIPTYPFGDGPRSDGQCCGTCGKLGVGCPFDGYPEGRVHGMNDWCGGWKRKPSDDKRIRKVSTLGDALRKRAKDRGLKDDDLVLVTTTIYKGRPPNYEIEKVEGSPTEWLLERAKKKPKPEDDKCPMCQRHRQEAQG